MIRLQLSEQQALHLLAALEALEALPACLEAPYGRLLASGCAAPYSSAMEALEARQ
jgi:hypothetical protein